MLPTVNKTRFNTNSAPEISAPFIIAKGMKYMLATKWSKPIAIKDVIGKNMAKIFPVIEHYVSKSVTYGSTFHETICLPIISSDAVDIQVAKQTSHVHPIPRISCWYQIIWTLFSPNLLTKEFQGSLSTRPASLVKKPATMTAPMKLPIYANAKCFAIFNGLMRLSIKLGKI